MKSLIIVILVIQTQLWGQIKLKDIGIIGLASHDLFTWDSKTKKNLENGRLDLSTIFDYDGGTRWEQGGNRKNSENAPVYTVTMRLVQFYKQQLQSGHSPQEARKRTVAAFHRAIKMSYERFVSMKFPKVGLIGRVTNSEQAAMRALHDILPGKIKAYNRRHPISGHKRNTITLTYLWNARIALNDKEMNQDIDYFDGSYDSEYLSIYVPFKKINLQEKDKNFIEEFSPYNQEEMLEELRRVGKKEITIDSVSFIHHVQDLFAKGVCSEKNPWMPKVTCLKL